MNYVIIIAVLAVIAYCIYKYCKSYKIPDETLMAFVGTMGSGKTYNAVARGVAKYRLQRLKYKLSKIIPVKSWKHEPHLYSNIPIRLRKNTYSEVLTTEHLLMKKPLAEKAVVVIDEIGQFASQWEYDNPYVMEQTQTLVRFFRHFTDGHLYITDQSTDSIAKPIRSRMGVVYQLHGFKRLLGFLPFYTVEVLPLYMVDSESTLSNANSDNADPMYVMGFLPYKWQKKLRKYDSRAYSIIYEAGASPYAEFDGMKSRYLIELQSTPEEKKQYTKDRKQYRGYLYRKMQDR